MAYMLALFDVSSGGESCNFIDEWSYEWRRGGLWCPPPPLKSEQPLLATDPEDRYENREVRIDLKIKGTTEDNLWSNVEKVNRLIRLAREQYENRLEPTVELRWRGNAATYITYFIIVGGSLDIGPIENAWIVAKEFPDCALTLECKPFARGVSLSGSLVAVALENGSVGSKTTSALTIWNHDDGTAGHDNWADIVAADVYGDQPAEIYLKGINHASSTNDLYRFHIAIRAKGTPADFVCSFNAEDNSSLGPDTALADDAASPGTGGTAGIGQKAVCDFATLADWNIRVTWRILQADIAKYHGTFRVYLSARQTAGSVGDTLVRITSWMVSSSYGAYLVGDNKSPPVETTVWPWIDMGLFSIPQGGFDPDQAEYLDFHAMAYRGVAGRVVEFSQMVLMPVDYPDQYILASVVAGDVLTVTSSDVGQGENILHRSLYQHKRGVFRRLSGDTEVLRLEQRGAPLFLVPNTDQRLVFGLANTTQADGTDPRYDIEDRLQVTVACNPRFLHVRGT